MQAALALAAVAVAAATMPASSPPPPAPNRTWNNTTTTANMSGGILWPTPAPRFRHARWVKGVRRRLPRWTAEGRHRRARSAGAARMTSPRCASPPPPSRNGLDSTLVFDNL